MTQKGEVGNSNPDPGESRCDPGEPWGWWGIGGTGGHLGIPPQFGLVEGIRLSNVTFSKKLIDQFFKS